MPPNATFRDLVLPGPSGRQRRDVDEGQAQIFSAATAEKEGKKQQDEQETEEKGKRIQRLAGGIYLLNNLR